MELDLLAASASRKVGEAGTRRGVLGLLTTRESTRGLSPKQAGAQARAIFVRWVSWNRFQLLSFVDPGTRLLTM